MNEETSKSIARSSITVEKDTLATILELVGSRPWLKQKSESLASLLTECSSKEETDLVVHLLSKFRYFDSYTLNAALDTALPEIEEKWELSPEDTVFSTLARDDNLDSGTLFLSAARNRLQSEGWKKSHFVSKFYAIDFEKESWIKKIVLCDDFTGTGRTLNRKVNWLRKKFAGIETNDCEIYFFGLVCMEFSISVIEKTLDKYHFCELLEKGLSDHFSGDELTEKVAASSRMEKQLHRPNKVKKFSRGYMQSESLYNLADTNIPNNVFPIFWWRKLVGGIPRKRIFRRVY